MSKRLRVAFLLSQAFLAGGCSCGSAGPTGAAASGAAASGAAASSGAPLAPLRLGAAVPAFSRLRVTESRVVRGQFERVEVTAKSVLTLQHVHGSFREVEVRDPATLDVVRTAGCPDKGDYLTDFAVAEDDSALVVTCNGGSRTIVVYAMSPLKERSRLVDADIVYAVSPDGATAFGWGRSGKPVLWSTKDSGATALTSFGGESERWGFRRGAISRDGSLVLGVRTFHEMGGSVPLNRVEVFDSKGTPRYTQRVSSLDSFAFSPDGKYLVRSECGKIVVLQAESGVTAMEAKVEEWGCDDVPLFAPKSNALLFWSRGALKTLSLGSGEIVDVAGPAPERGELVRVTGDGTHLVSTKKGGIGAKESWVQTSALEEAAVSK